MVFTLRHKQQILDAIHQRAPDMRACPLCGRSQWAVADGSVFLVLQPEPGLLALAGPGLPCAALVCSNCGNTHLLNLMVLGLEHLTESAPIEEPAPTHG